MLEKLDPKKVEPLWLDKIDLDMQKGLFFEYTALEQPNVGKVCLQTKMYDSENHPGNIESSILRLLNDVAIREKLQCRKFLPETFFHGRFPVTAPELLALPMRAFKTNIHPWCHIFISKRYSENFYDLRERNELTLDEYRYLIFGVLFALYELQSTFGFVNNDMHIENILIENLDDEDQKVDEKYHIGKECFHIKTKSRYRAILWDFENAICQNIPGLEKNETGLNEKDVPQGFCDKYDAHFFLISVLDTFATGDAGEIPAPLWKWIHAMYPKKALPTRIQKFERSNERKQKESRLEIKGLLREAAKWTGMAKWTKPKHTKLKDLAKLAAAISDTESESESDGTETDSESSDSEDDDYYEPGDNYYDYLKSEHPKHGMAWDPVLMELSERSQANDSVDADTSAATPIKEKEDYTINNRLANDFPEREKLPTPESLLMSDFFHSYRKKGP